MKHELCRHRTATNNVCLHSMEWNVAVWLSLEATRSRGRGGQTHSSAQGPLGSGTGRSLPSRGERPSSQTCPLFCALAPYILVQVSSYTLLMIVPAPFVQCCKRHNRTPTAGISGHQKEATVFAVCFTVPVPYSLQVQADHTHLHLHNCMTDQS